MAKITLPDVGSLANQLSAQANINSVSATIENAWENNLSRDGTGPNQMEADLDMNSNTVLNVADPVAETDAVNLRSVRPLVNQFAGEIAETIIEGTLRVDVFTATAAQTQFPLTDTPGTVNNVQVSVNGLIKIPSVDYTLSGADSKTLEFFVGLSAGDKVIARYTQLSPADSLLRADLLSTLVGKGAAIVGWIGSGVGAVARFLLDKVRERPSVLDYISTTLHAGLAAGTETSNQAAAFNSALTAHKEVFIPAGEYTLTDIVTIPIGYKLRGAGRRKTIIKVPATFNLAALGVLRFAAGADGGEIADLTIEFTQPDSAVVGDYTQYPPAVYAVGVPRFKLTNVRITQAWDGVKMTGNSGGAVIEDLEISAFNKHIEIDGSLDTVKLDKIHIWPFGIGNATLTLDQRTVYQAAFGIHCGKCDDFKLSNSLVFSLIKGLYFYNSGSGYTFGAITNTALDDRGGLWIVTDGRLAMTGGSMSMGRTDGHFINMTGGSLAVEGVRFQVSALQAVGNGLMELSGGTLSLGGGCLIEGAAHDKAFVYAANGHFRATGAYFSRNTNIAYASPMVRIINSGGSLTGCYASAIGSGSGKFVQIDTDNAAGYVVRGNNLRGWTVQVPTGSALTNTMVDSNLGVGSNKDTFSGYFSSDATTTVKLPNGWSVAKPGAGNYTITHNLSLAAATDLIPVAIGGLADSTIISDPAGGSANTFKLRAYIGGVATDCDIHFHVMRYRA